MKKFKKVLSLLMMSAMLILPTALPVQAEEIDNDDIEVAVLSNGDVSVNATYTGRGKINTNGVYLRSGAGTNTTALEWMAIDEEVVIDKSGIKTDSNGNAWYHVKRIKTGTTGYVRSKYVTVYF